MSRIDDLVSKITIARREYYGGSPTLSDDEYDRLEDELREIEPSHWVLQRVGTNCGSIIHEPPMLSSNKATSVETIIKWAGNKPITWGYKVDGMSVRLIYVDGELERAVSRGDGQSGDDITKHARLLNIPLKIVLPGVVDVRGEAYIPLSKFKRGGEHKSPRNLATGTMMSNTPLDVKQRHVHFTAWDMIKDIPTDKKIDELKLLGFDTADVRLVKPSEIGTLYEQLIRERDTHDFEMDGLVFKYNDANDRNDAGVTSHHPRWMMALKFPSVESTTVIRKIDWQVGRTGKVTPVATVSPVNLAGATITRATLHNARFLKDKKISIGDTVSIVRSGDVIPKILDVIESNGAEPIIPTKCPNCDNGLTDDGVFLKCVNSGCGDIAKKRIEHFIKIVGIDQIGVKSIETLWKHNNVRHPAALYRLDPILLEREFGINGRKMYKNIQNSKKIDMAVFLTSLGISSLGLSTAKKLCQDISTLDELTDSKIRSLVGPVIAQSVIDGLGDRSLFEPYRAVGISFTKTKKSSSTMTSNTLNGKTIYITGSVPGYTKDGLTKLVEDNGGVWKSLSKSLDFLVIGDKAGPAKIAKASEYGIEMVSIEKFMSMIGK